MTIEEFLLARIAEDEAQAHYTREWGSSGPLELFSPTRILAECKAKRAILIMHAAEDWGYPHKLCATCADWDDEQIGEGPPPIKHPCPTSRALATVYSGHPDYQPEWKPSGPGD